MMRTMATILAAAASIAALSGSAWAEEGKRGVQGTVVWVEQPGDRPVSASVGDRVAILFHIPVIPGAGSPDDLTVVVDGQAGILRSEENVAVVRPLVIGSSSYAAVLKAEKEGTATVTFGINGRRTVTQKISVRARQ